MGNNPSDTAKVSPEEEFCEHSIEVGESSNTFLQAQKTTRGCTTPVVFKVSPIKNCENINELDLTNDPPIEELDIDRCISPAQEHSRKLLEWELVDSHVDDWTDRTIQEGQLRVEEFGPYGSRLIGQSFYHPVLSAKLPISEFIKIELENYGSNNVIIGVADINTDIGVPFHNNRDCIGFSLGGIRGPEIYNGGKICRRPAIGPRDLPCPCSVTLLVDRIGGRLTAMYIDENGTPLCYSITNERLMHSPLCIAAATYAYDANIALSSISQHGHED